MPKVENSIISEDLLTPRSEVDFTLPQYQDALSSNLTPRLCTYLMSLAAYQRGLEVKFFGSSVAAKTSAWGKPIKSKVPRLFIVSDGKKRHFFDQTVGDLTSRSAVRKSNNKERLRWALLSTGVQMPDSILCDGNNLSAVQRFLSNSKSSSFVIKPVAGSLGKGMMNKFTRSDVSEYLKRYAEDKNLLVQENIEGREFRVFVVGDRIAAAFERLGIFVVGNGLHTIAKLIQNHNTRRQANINYKDNLILLHRAADFLAIFGKSIHDVPVLGEKVYLDPTNARSFGGAEVDVTLELPDDVAKAAIDASLAIDLPNCGVDIIKNDQAAFVLETNARANISVASLPSNGRGAGNSVAEAIVDYYFPSAEPIKRDSGRVLKFDEVNRAFKLNGENTVFTLK